jgi:uncharacterized protein (DUF2267 family)
VEVEALKPDPIEATVTKTRHWLATVDQSLGPDAPRGVAYACLRAVLHALRDRLTIEQAAHLGAQLPMLVRGMFYEGWHPAGKPLRLRHTEEFLALIEAELAPDRLDAEIAARAVFRTLERHLDAGESDKIVHSLPKEIRELWRPEIHTRDE